MYESSDQCAAIIAVVEPLQPVSAIHAIFCRPPGRIVFFILSLILAFPAGPAWAQKPDRQLRIVDVLFEDYKGELSSRWQMRAGEEVLLSFLVDGFGRRPAENPDGTRFEKVNLHYRIELRDPLGVLVTPEEEGEVQTDLGPRDEKWRPKIHWSARVPSAAPSGDFAIRILINDRIADQDVASNVSFRVRGQSVEASDHLQVAHLEFSSSEGGPWSPVRYFASKEAIWVRYLVVGYHVSSDKEVWVEQDWSVLDADGKVIAEQTNAAVEKQRDFYAPRFLSTLFNLALKDPKPGKYTIHIDLRDRVGEQMASLESDFFLRP